MNLNEKNVVFVGLGGIGFESCKCLMTKNLANLIIMDLAECPDKMKIIQEINKNTKVSFLKCDITNKSSIKNALEQAVNIVDYIDVLVNGAGVIADRNVELTINVNLIGLINTTLEALPYMDKSNKGRGGVILNIASVLGLEPMGSISVYSASKFGVVGFTRSLADPFYYNRTGVTMLGLCPGFTTTPMTTNPISDTFEYSKPLTDHVISSVSFQPPAKAGEHLVEVLEKGENGSFWITDRCTLRKAEFKTFWEI